MVFVAVSKPACTRVGLVSSAYGGQIHSLMLSGFRLKANSRILKACSTVVVCTIAKRSNTN